MKDYEKAICSTLEGLDEKGKEITKGLIKRYRNKEVLNEISDSGGWEHPLLFPSIWHLIDTIDMCKVMQKQEGVTESTVIDYELVYLHQTKGGAERLTYLECKPDVSEFEKDILTVMERWLDGLI